MKRRLVTTEAVQRMTAKKTVARTMLMRYIPNKTHYAPCYKSESETRLMYRLSQDEEDDEEDEDDPEIDASQVSFGALAKAQATLPSARRKGGQSRGGGGEEGDNSDNNSDAEEQEEAPAWGPSKNKKPARVVGRSNKHAPAEQSSKRPVGRRREVVSSATPVAARDPRFDPMLAARSSAGLTPADEDRTRRAYAFLDEYQETEMARLKEAIQQAKAVAKKAKARGGVGEAARELEELKRALASMQDRRRTQQRREKEKALVAEHRRREKELVREGKKSAPFYLKRSEQRKQLLVDRFAGMKKGQVDHTIERRRKKLASRERREMPMARRERPS